MGMKRKEVERTVREAALDYARNPHNQFYEGRFNGIRAMALNWFIGPELDNIWAKAVEQADDEKSRPDLQP